jgi:hypothetical protein
MFCNTILLGMQRLNFSGINGSFCPSCIPPEYQRNGYDMIAAGDWGSLIAQYGIQSVIIFIIALLGLHLISKAFEDYYRRKRHEKHDK